MTTAAEHREPSIRIYVYILLGLLFLTAATVGVTFLELGRWTVVVGLAIAGIKATLVVLFFMHVRESSTLTKFMCAAGLVWLTILMTLTFSDYISRTWLPTPGGW